MNKTRLLLLSVLMLGCFVPIVGCDEYLDGFIVTVDVFPRPGFFYFNDFRNFDDDDDFFDDLGDFFDDLGDDLDDLFDD